MTGKICYTEIEQIIPAQPGWTAVFSDDISYYEIPIACWALVNSDGGEQSKVTVGMVADEEATLSIADKKVGFLGYNYPPSSENWWKHSKEYRNAQESSHEQESTDSDNNSALTQYI